MELLRELLQVNQDLETSLLFEELGNLGQLGLGSMVNAFKQSYAAYSRGRGETRYVTGPEGKKFDPSFIAIGKDSEAVDGGVVKNWPAVKRAYKKVTDSNPQAAIFLVDDKPVALMIATHYDTDSINNRVALAWDFSKVAPTKEEVDALTAGLRTHTGGWKDIVGGSAKLGASGKMEVEKERDYNFKKGEYEEKFTSKKYSGITQTVREIVPFVKNMGEAFGDRLTIKLILADKTRMAKRGERMKNQPLDPKEIKLFQDDIKTRLAKYKNSKAVTAEDAKDFVEKVFGGGLKKIRLAGSTYSAVPNKKYMGSSHERNTRSSPARYFYDGTMSDLLAGKPVTMEFEADRKESDYNTLYLTVKFEKGQIVPVEMRYTDKEKGSYGSSEKVKF